MPEEVVILGSVRTGIGKFGRSLRDIPAQRLGAQVITAALNRVGIEPRYVDEVIMGNVISTGLGQNPARQAAIFAGLPPEIGSLTVNKVCGSGLKAVMLAAQAIRAGDAHIIVAGGMENMSASPHYVRGLRWGVRFGDVLTKDAMLYDGLWEAYNDYHMGITGERVAQKYGITREDADRFALQSHQKASDAIRKGKFKEEIVAIEAQGALFDKDECVREDTSLEKMATLLPVFKSDGVLTAGNSSQLSDGAAALVIASARKAEELHIQPLARIVDYVIGGTRPEDIMEAPIPTVKKIIKRTGLTINEMDLVEYNEAYATSSVVILRELNIDPRKFNVNGGAVALGHPIGCSGARILVTLLHALKERRLKRGLATLCMGGGNALAMIVER
ncbi:MAG TPA: acetyl-CoA C-acetyltransferase [Thermodesulfovibrionales bacterium]|nr:acetyl-CoA C-acetyltransferase [Thermodesulfovibrionales bacterium]